MLIAFFQNIILSIKDMVNELQSLEFASFTELLLRMIYSLIFILLLVGIFQLLHYIIMFILRFIMKIEIQKILLKLVGA